MALTNFSAQPQLTSFGGGRTAVAHFGIAPGALELTPHNVIHGQIGGPGAGQCQGGLMSDARCAARDPIFWLHHANIDRLWNDWLALGGNRANPTEEAWLEQSFVFHDETGATVTLTGSEVVDSAAQLGYVYDNVPLTRAVGIAASSPPPGDSPQPPELAAASEETLELTGTTRSVPLAMPARSRGIVEDAAAAPDRRLLLSVEDIEGERNPGVAYAVYLDVPGEEGDAPRERRHVGNVSFFGIELMEDPDRPHDAAPGLRHVFDATDAVNTLRAQGRWDPSDVRVTFEPITVLPAPGQEVPPDDRSLAPPPPIHIGRVGLFAT
jgi:tyrosinase